MFYKKLTTNCFFSLKEQYLLTHNQNGREYWLDKLSKSRQKKLTYNNMHLAKNMQFTEENGIPIVNRYTGPVDFNVFPFAERKKHSGIQEGLHFFTDDYKYCSAITANLERTTYSMINYDFLYEPDCSLYVGDKKGFNIQSIIISRFAAAYWQSCGFNVIPVASWGDVNSFEYCFEGLPTESVIAVCGIGHSHCTAAKTLWEYAINTLVTLKHPTHLIIFGGNDIPKIDLPVTHIKDYINTKLRTL